MKRIIAAFLSVFVALTLAFSASPVPAVAAQESHVYVNNTSDKWVWITVYDYVYQKILSDKYTERNAGAWCVAPGEFDKHGLSTTVQRVRAEVTNSGCKHPVAMDVSLRFPHNGAIQTNTFVLAGRSGHYTFTQQR